MKIGFGSIKITPSKSMKMAGYIRRKGKSIGVHDDLFVKCIIIDKIPIFSYDLLGISGELFNAIRSRYPDAIVAATHTHSAPLLDSTYTEFLLECSVEAYRKAMSSLEDSVIFFSNFNIDDVCSNRISSKFKGGKDAVLLRNKNGGILIYGCHPTILGPENLLYSSDLAGVLTRKLEDRYGGTYIYLNSCAGDISTHFVRKKRTFNEIDRLSRIFLKQIPSKFRIVEGKVGYKKRNCILECKAKNLDDRVWETIEDGRLYLESERDILTGETIPEKKNISFEINAVKIGEMIFLFYPLELESFTCRKIKKIGRKYGLCSFAIGYSNGYFGYLPAREIRDLPTYENLVSPFDGDAEEKILSVTEDLIQHACLT